jgi:hypothetical protein
LVTFRTVKPSPAAEPFPLPFTVNYQMPFATTAVHSFLRADYTDAARELSHLISALPRYLEIAEFISDQLWHTNLLDGRCYGPGEI